MYLQSHSSASVKVVFVGSERVGKTSLLKRCIGGSWDPSYGTTSRSNMSFWPIQSSRGPVECLETMPTKDKKTKANELSFEKSREKPIDHSVWTTWGDVFVFVYSTESLESYNESLTLMKNWIAYKSSRVVTPVGYEELSTAAVTMKLPVLWIGTKCDSSNRAVPSPDQIAAAAQPLPIKWLEVSARTGANIDTMQEWLYEVWDALKSREQSINIHCISQLSNILSTKHCKGGTLLVNLETLGRCVRHGTLLKVTKFGFKQEMACFLFEKALLFCKPPNKGIYSVKKAIFLNLAVLTDSSRPANDYAFEFHSFSKAFAPTKSSSSKERDDHAPTSTWTLMALGQADKDAWMDALTFAINGFSRDSDRAKCYSALKSLALASRPIQRHGRRQIGLPWSLLANNISSGIPIILDSLTAFLNNPSADSWGIFILPGNPAEMKALSERANRVDVSRSNFSSSTSGPASTGSISQQQRETVSPSSLSSSQLLAASPPPASAGASLIGSNIQHAASGGDRTIDMSGISPTTAADFLLGFLNATPTFVPVGFFTFLIQSCHDIHLDSAAGTLHLKVAFSTLPSHIWKSLARLMFCVQQSLLNCTDDSVVLKVARYLQPILVKDSVEFESLNNVKLLLLIQALIREADGIFGMPTEAVASPNSASLAAKHHYHNISGSSGSSSPTGARTLSNNQLVPPNNTLTSPINIGGHSTAHLTAGGTVAATPSPRDQLSSFTPSSFTLLSFGSPPAQSTVGVATAGSLGTTIDTDFFTVTSNHSDSQSSISELLRGMSFDSSGGGSAAALMAAANAKKIGNFGGLSRPLTANNVEGMGPLNSDQVMSRIARARAIIAELLENLKGVENIITAPEIEAVLQHLVITCNNLSRYNWNKYLEMIETDILDELCYILDVFDRHTKTKPIEKTLKSKQSRTHLASLAAEMSALMNQFMAYIVNLQGYDLAAPPGDKPKPRRVGGLLGGLGGLSSSSSQIGPPGTPHSLGGAMSPSGTSAGGSGNPLGDTDGVYGTYNGTESGEQRADMVDVNNMSAKEWWEYVFGQHSLRVSVEKFLAELMYVSRSSTPVLDSSSGTTPGVGTPTPGGMSSAFSAALLTSNSEDMSGSQPGTPRGNGHAATESKNGLAQLPPLEISQKENKALIQFFDHQGSGFISLLKFSQFLKAFGAIPFCIESALQVMRLPGYYGYLSPFEAIRLLETEDAGTYLLCFESNDPSNWVVHCMDEGLTHKAFSIDASPTEYVLRQTRVLVVAGVAQESASQRAMPPKSPRASVSDTVPPILIETSPRQVLSDSSATNVTASSSQPASDKLASSASPGPGSTASAASSTHLRSASAESTSSGDAPRIEITSNGEPISSYPTLPSLIDAHPLTLRHPLRSNLYSLPFFYGDLSESEGMRALKSQPPGTFLIIFSASKPLALECLYVAGVEDRLMQLTFERQRADGQSKSGRAISARFIDTTKALDDASGAEINENFFNLAKEKDRVSVRVESGEVFENLSDAIRFYGSELKTPFTQKKSSGHVSMGSVHEGSLEKLVAYLYDDVVDLVYITAFLLTYRSFTQPPTLLEELITQYRHLESIDNGKPYQMRLVNFFKIWLSDFSWDLVTAQDTLANIKTFVNTDISTLFPSIAKQLVVYISKVPTEKLLEPAPQQGIVSPVPTPQSYEEPSKVWDYSAPYLAQQLFAFEFELFSKIQPFELMGTGWMKGDKHVRAPNIVRMIAKSNLIGSWIVAEILKEANVKKRASLIEHYISVVEESFALNNFHSAMVVLSILRDSSVARLRLTWERVSRKSRELFEAFETKMDDEDNFAAYRTAYAQAPPPKLPYMGLVFRDLIHIEEGSPKHLPNGSINFHRCELIAEKLHLVKLSQQDRLHWPKNEDLWYYILNFPKHPDVQSQYQRSLELEPRAGTPSNVGASPNVARATTVGPSSATPGDRQTRVSVFTPASPSVAHHPSGDTGSSEQGGIQIPSRGSSPMPGGTDSNSPTSSPTSSHAGASRDTLSGAPDSGKWATPKKGTKPSPMANVMGFMRNNKK